MVALHRHDVVRSLLDGDEAGGLGAAMSGRRASTHERPPRPTRGSAARAPRISPPGCPKRPAPDQARAVHHGGDEHPVRVGAARALGAPPICVGVATPTRWMCARAASVALSSGCGRPARPPTAAGPRSAAPSASFRRRRDRQILASDGAHPADSGTPRRQSKGYVAAPPTAPAARARSPTTPVRQARRVPPARPVPAGAPTSPSRLPMLPFLSSLPPNSNSLGQQHRMPEQSESASTREARLRTRPAGRTRKRQLFATKCSLRNCCSAAQPISLACALNAPEHQPKSASHCPSGPGSPSSDQCPRFGTSVPLRPLRRVPNRTHRNLRQRIAKPVPRLPHHNAFQTFTEHYHADLPLW